MRKPAGVLTSAGQQASSLRSVALHYHGSVPFRYRFSLYAPIGTAIAEIRLLGISAPQFETGAAGTGYFEPGGVFFRDCLRANLQRWLTSRMRARFLMRSAPAAAFVKSPPFPLPHSIMARPLFSTITSRSTTRARNETLEPSTQISVRIVSPGWTGNEKRSFRDLSRPGL